MSTRNLLTVLFVGICVAWPGSAVAQGFQSHADHDHIKFVAPGLRLDHASRDWHEVDHLAAAPRADNPWTAFVDRLGPGWKVNHDQAFGTPRWILGPGLETGQLPLSVEAAVARSRELARELRGSLGIDDLTALELDRTGLSVNPHGHRLLNVDFVQTVNGYRVRTLQESRRVTFRWDLTLGKLSNLSSGWLPELSVNTNAVVTPDVAVSRAHELIPAYAPGTGRVRGVDTFILVGVEGETGVAARLVHQVQIQSDAPAHDWIVVLDARTGDKLFVADLLCHVDVKGNVALGCLDGAGGVPPAVPFSVKPARNLLVSVAGGGSALTDQNGDFTVSHSGSTQVTLSGRFAGAHCTVQTQAGSNTSFSQPAMPGTPVNVVLNSTHTSEYVTAEATAYYWINAVWDYVDRVTPNFNYSLLRQLTTNVNLSNTCNAYWNGSSINFFQAGGGCNNTAIPEVMCHEWGHGFHQAWGGSITNGGFSEGIADHMGLYVTAQRVMGRGFRTTGGVVRDYRVGGAANNTQWPKTGTVHRDGEIWAGAMMDLRDYLITKHGSAPGIDLADKITIPQYSRATPPTMPDGVREVMVEDDNDANLLNGTPNFVEIAAAADRHNLPRPPDPLIVQFTHTPLTTSRDVVNDHVVSSKIISTEGTITQAVLVYQIGSGSWNTINLSRGSNDIYSATIPAQPAVSVISYRLTATDSKSNTAGDPSSGYHTFTVGHEVVSFSDDFETVKGWTPDPGDNATAGRFERADPINAYYYSNPSWINQPEDDHTPAPGIYCYVTQNGTRSQQQYGYQHDVDGGKTSMISPAFDLSGVPSGAATVDFAYWFTNYIANDDYLRLDVSSDGGQNWRSVWSTNASEAKWKEAQGVVLSGPYSNAMKLRFWTYDLGTGSQTDALIDDVVVRSVDDNVAALQAQTRTPSIGVTLNYSLQAAKEPNASFVYAIAFTPGPTVIQNVGTSGLGLPLFPIIMGGVLNGSGQSNFPIPIPNDPLLKGFRIYTEAFVGGKAFIFSNLWTVDIQ